MDPPPFSGINKQVGARMSSLYSVTVSPGRDRYFVFNPYVPGGGYYSDEVDPAVSKVTTFSYLYGSTVEDTSANFFSQIDFPASPLPGNADCYDFNPSNFKTFMTDAAGVVGGAPLTWNAQVITQKPFDTLKSSFMPADKYTYVQTNPPAEDDGRISNVGTYGSGGARPEQAQTQNVQFTGGQAILELAVPYQAQAVVHVMDSKANERVHTANSPANFNGSAPLNTVGLRDQTWLDQDWVQGVQVVRGTRDLGGVLDKFYAPSYCQGGTDTGRMCFAMQTPPWDISTTFRCGALDHAASPQTQMLPTVAPGSSIPDAPQYYNLQELTDRAKYVVRGAAGTSSPGVDALAYQYALAAYPAFCNLADGAIGHTCASNDNGFNDSYSPGNNITAYGNPNAPSTPIPSLFSIEGFFKTARSIVRVRNTAGAGGGSIAVNVKVINDYAMVVDPSLAVANRADPVLGYSPSEAPRHVGYSAAGQTRGEALAAVTAKSADALQHHHPAASAIVHGALEQVAAKADDVLGGNMLTTGAKVLETVIDPAQAVEVATDKIAEHLPGPLGGLAKDLIHGVQESSVENIVSDIISDPAEAIGDFFGDLFG